MSNKCIKIHHVQKSEWVTNVTSVDLSKQIYYLSMIQSWVQDINILLSK